MMDGVKGKGVSDWGPALSTQTSVTDGATAALVALEA